MIFSKNINKTDLPCVWCCVCFCLCAFGAILKRFTRLWFFMLTLHWENREGCLLSGSTVAMARARSSINSTKVLQSLQNCRQHTCRWSSFLFATPKGPRFIFIAPKTLDFQPILCCFCFLPMRYPALWEIWLTGDLNSNSTVAQRPLGVRVIVTICPQPGICTVSCKPNGEGIPASIWPEIAVKCYQK